ncbi:hypothetical protein PSAR109036_02235 [Psychrobacter arenosus]|uniref:hypothetical protein n=1 Tax=Psychrobacter arenosus TaxID=256326 RepID=UPI001918F5EA|nr:hypothetical protein [Psychrobacter arenosus]
MNTNDPHLSKTPIASDDNTLTRNDAGLIDDSMAAEDPRLAAETSVNKGTETFDDKDVVGTEHVKAGDMPARQPDRRDQEGNAFDEGINENTTANASPHNPKSDEITDLNRYASVDNAQTRVLNTTDQREE